MGIGKLFDSVRSAVGQMASEPPSYKEIVDDKNRLIFSENLEDDGALISKDSKIKQSWHRLCEGVSAAKSKVLEKLSSTLHIKTNRQ